MTDWNSPEVLEFLTSMPRPPTHPLLADLFVPLDIFKKQIYIFFGIYAWEVVNTMHVERSLLFRMRSFQWPQSTSVPIPRLIPLLTHFSYIVIYLLCRYTLLTALIGL